jgi:hypothetical protein
MNTRERFQAIINFQPFDRLPILEWAGWWDKTIDRWHQEGLPQDLTDRYDICRHFGLDVYKQDWFETCEPRCPQPSSHGSGIIKNKDEYDGIINFLYPDSAVNCELWERWAKEQKRGDVVLWATLNGFFWMPRKLMGIERHLYAFYDQPELMHRINSDLTEWILLTIEKLCKICSPDFITFAEDMSYNNGPMLSKELFDEFIKPYYDKVIPALKKHNIIPIIDSDGDISMPSQWFSDVGVKGILPLERQAGVDLAKLRKEHPGMIFIGHFDKMTMSRGEAAIRTEFERLLPIAAKGGFLISCDHQTPPGVSYTDYQLYLSLFRE